MRFWRTPRGAGLRIKMSQLKRCNKCETEKPLDNFNKNRSRKDGRQSWCRACVAIYDNSPKMKAARRRYERSEEGKAARRRYLKTEKGSAMIKLASKKWRQTRKGKALGYKLHLAYIRRHPERRNARYAIRRAVETNKMPRPTQLQCEYCENQAEHYHHDDYNRPLDVTPLCRLCHEDLHRTK